MEKAVVVEWEVKGPKEEWDWGKWPGLALLAFTEPWQKLPRSHAQESLCPGLASWDFEQAEKAGKQIEEDKALLLKNNNANNNGSSRLLPFTVTF